MLKRILTALSAAFSDEPPVGETRDWDLCPFIHPMEAARGYAGHLVDSQGKDYVDVL